MTPVERVDKLESETLVTRVEDMIRNVYRGSHIKMSYLATLNRAIQDL